MQFLRQRVDALLFSTFLSCRRLFPVGQAYNNERDTLTQKVYHLSYFFAIEFSKTGRAIASYFSGKPPKMIRNQVF
jgi:hypothetical protein